MPRHRLCGEHVYDGVVLSSHMFEQNIRDIQTLDMKGDVLIASYPKTGTTWLQEIVYLIQTKGDFTSALANPQSSRIPFLEFMMYESKVCGIQQARSQPHPRIMKTHMQLRYVEQQIRGGQVKVIVPVRNPKDTLVSYFHFYQISQDFNHFDGTWEEFFKLYEDKYLAFGDYFDWYDNFLKFSLFSNVYLVHYENMQSDLMGEIIKIASFLDISLDEDLLAKIEEHTKFGTMSKNKMVNNECMSLATKPDSKFMRKGLVGDWKNYFTSNQNEIIQAKYDKWVANGGVSVQFE